MSTTDLSAPPNTLPAPLPWPQLVVLTAATFLTVTAEMLPSGLLPQISRGLDVPESGVGMLVSVWAITIAVTSIPLVRLTLWVPRRALLTAALVVTALATLVTSAAPTFAVALTFRLLAASAHGLFWAVVVAYAASIVDPRRLGRALSIVLAGPMLAGLVNLPAAAFVAERAGWRPVFAALAVLLLLAALAHRLILPPSTTAAGTSAGGAWDRSGVGVIMVIAAGALTLIGHFATFTYVTTLITGTGGLGIAAIPAVLLVLGLTGGIGVLFSGVLSDRLPRAAVLIAAGAVTGGLVLLSLSDGRPPLFLAGVVVWGVAIGLYPPVLQTRVLRLSSNSFRPLAGSVVVTVFNLALATGATLGAFALGHGQGALLVASASTATAGLLALLLARVSHRAEPG